MADNLEEIQKSVKKYLVIGGLLLLFTVITVWLSYVELPTHSMNIMVGMIVAAFKASLVALIFMHLNHEKKIIYKVLLFTVILVSVLFILFYMTHGDPLIFEGFDKTSIKHH